MIASLPTSTRASRIMRLATSRPEIAAVTGPLDALVGSDVLVLADDENLRYGARDLGYRLCWRRLGKCLQRYTSQCVLHAFFSRAPGDEGRCLYLRDCGWIPHPRDIVTVETHDGTQRLANSDNDLLFAAGNLANSGKPNIMILASGDGTLVCDLARNLRELPGARRILTLSLAGSTSCRLDAARNRHIDANIEIGLDCMDWRPC